MHFIGLLCLVVCSALADDVDDFLNFKVTGDEKPTDANINYGYHNILSDPCAHKHCGHGRYCDVDQLTGKAICACVEECDPPDEIHPERDQVCSTQNETYITECHLDQERCFCRDKMPNCENKKHKRAHLDYYGSCKRIEECTGDQLMDMPGRLREWFFLIMKDLANERKISSNAILLLKEQENKPKHWAMPVIWKFCDLDRHPRNKEVSRRELLPLAAPIKKMEHCLGDFLDNCDANSDRKISIAEWGHCLGMDDDDIETWENSCDSLQAKDHFIF